MMGGSALLTQEQERRYRRQLVIPEIGVEGQIKLGKASVLIVGLGGLGSISSNYLAAAGVGRLRIVDRDNVALDNLNRQILYATPDLGRQKVATAAEKLTGAGAHYVIDSVADLMPVIASIEGRLARGERP